MRLRRSLSRQYGVWLVPPWPRPAPARPCGLRARHGGTCANHALGRQPPAPAGSCCAREARRAHTCVPCLLGLAGNAACPAACGYRSAPRPRLGAACSRALCTLAARVLQAREGTAPGTAPGPAPCRVRGARRAAHDASSDAEVPLVARPSCAAPPLCFLLHARTLKNVEKFKVLHNKPGLKTASKKSSLDPSNFLVVLIAGVAPRHQSWQPAFLCVPGP